MKRYISSLTILTLLLLGSNLYGRFQEDKVIVYKDKDSPVFDGGNFCSGSGSKCVELSAAELAGVIKFLKTLQK
jgi:hypothetical protein